MSDSSIDGKRFKDLFIAGSARLDEAKEYLNSINVFPVPDADTGANMASTMNNAVDALHDIEDHSLENVLETIQKKLRMEAKGNSGIILSEFFHGMFQKIKKDDSIKPGNFIEAMSHGREAAYYDSQSVSLGVGVMALEAARMAKEGETMERIMARLDEIKSKVSILFTVDTLEYLAKNGRIGKAQKFIGQMIGVKPILECKDGEVCSRSKALGSKRVIDKLIAILKDKARADNFEGAYAVVYSDNPEARDELIDRMRDTLTIKTLVTGQISPVIGAHTGPGTLGVGCF